MNIDQEIMSFEDVLGRPPKRVKHVNALQAHRNARLTFTDSHLAGQVCLISVGCETWIQGSVSTQLIASMRCMGMSAFAIICCDNVISGERFFMQR